MFGGLDRWGLWAGWRGQKFGSKQMTSSSGRICGSRAQRLCYGSELAVYARKRRPWGARCCSLSRTALPILCDSFSWQVTRRSDSQIRGRWGIQAVAGHTEGPKSVANPPICGAPKRHWARRALREPSPEPLRNLDPGSFRIDPFLLLSDAMHVYRQL